MKWAVREFTTKEEIDKKRKFILLPPKGKVQGIANQYKGQEQKLSLLPFPLLKTLGKERRGMDFLAAPVAT